jgi:Family of unknown function (DUF6338)
VAPATGTALLVLAVFVLPGFVALLIRERTYAVRGEDSPFERLLNALYYSSIIYVLALAVALLAHLKKRDIVRIYHGRASLVGQAGVVVLIGVVLPILVAEGGRRWRASKHLRPWWLRKLHISESHTVSSGWNQAFGREGTAMVRATLRDGRVVGGYYGPGSLAGYSEHTQDLFIAERWALDDDGWFVQRADGTLGVWIPHDNIASVEFYEPSNQEPPPVLEAAQPGATL